MNGGSVDKGVERTGSYISSGMRYFCSYGGRSASSLPAHPPVRTCLLPLHAFTGTNP